MAKLEACPKETWRTSIRFWKNKSKHSWKIESAIQRCLKVAEDDKFKSGFMIIVVLVSLGRRSHRVTCHQFFSKWGFCFGVL